MKPTEEKFQNISDYFKQKCEKFSIRSFVETFDGKEFSYASFWVEVQTAQNMVDSVGLKEGDRFSIILENTASFLAILIAALSKGGIAVNLNKDLTNAELEERLLSAEVKFVFAEQSEANRLHEFFKKQQIICVLINQENECIVYNKELLYANDSRVHKISKLTTHNHVAFLQYTGGTTGNTKAAVISHQNVLASVNQMANYFSKLLKEGEEVFIVTFPFYHVFSIVFQVLMAMRFGAKIILYPNVRDFQVLESIMEKELFTVFVGVHTLYTKLLQSEKLKGRRFSRTKVFIAGAEHIQPSTKLKWLQKTGHYIVEGYGLTETSALVSLSNLNRSANDFDSIGQPLPQTLFMLIDEEGSEINQHNKAGELCVKGPQVVSSYWNNELENEAAFVNGWFKTGDIAIRKESNEYKIVDRKKDMINVSGNKVFSGEVEKVILDFDGIVDCAVVAKPDFKSGERVVVFYKSCNVINESELKEHCVQFLAAYKIPIRFYRIDELPRTAVGKILKSKMRQMAKDIE